MQTLILTLHLIVCFLLVVLILLQSGKEGMGVIFGGGNSSVFGSAGAGGILAKLTTLMAIIFVITSLSYTYVTSSRPSSESTILDVQIEEVIPVPAPTESQSQPEAAPATAPADAASTSVAPAETAVPAEPAQQTPEAMPDPAPAVEQPVESAPVPEQHPAPNSGASPAQDGNPMESRSDNTPAQ